MNNKLMVYCFNHDTFDQQDYDSEVPIKREGVYRWLPLPLMPTRKKVYLNKVDLILEDNLLMTIDDITGQE